MRFFIGVIVGITVATIGFTGVATLLDNSVKTFQQKIKETSQ